MMNQNKINNFRDFYFQTNCIGSELEGIQVLIQALMGATGARIRAEIAGFIAELYTNYSDSIKQKSEAFLQSVYKQINQNFENQWCCSYTFNQISKILGYEALTIQLLHASQVKGLGQYKPHKSLVSVSFVHIKIISQIDLHIPLNNRVYERMYKASQIFYQVVEDACLYFVCDMSKIQIKYQNKNLSLKKSGFTLQQLQLDGKTLKFSYSYKNMPRNKAYRQKIFQNGKLSAKVKRVIAEIFEKFSTQGKMDEKQCTSFVIEVTNRNLDSQDGRVVNFLQQYGSQNGRYVTLDSFIKFYSDRASQKSDSDIWTNLKNMGYRYDLMKQKQSLAPLPDALMLRSYLCKNQKIYETLFEMLKYQDKQLQKQTANILFHLPSSQALKRDEKLKYQLKDKNYIETQYYLILILYELQNSRDEQKRRKIYEKQNLIQIFQILEKFWQTEDKPLPINKCILLTMKILRFLCPIRSLQLFSDEQNLLQIPQNQTINSLDLPQDTKIFVQLLKQAYKYQLVQLIQSLFALQLFNNCKTKDKQLNNLGLRQALEGIFHQNKEIRIISCNFIYYLNYYGPIATQLFQYQANQNSNQWFQMLSKIIQKSTNINLQQLLDFYISKVSQIKQNIQNRYDPIQNGYLVVILSIIRKKKVHVNYQKIINILNKTISSKNRELIYFILAQIDYQNTILLVKQILENTKIYPENQLSLKNKFVGLNNLGNTCYVNSILQLFFWIQKFRDLVLSIDPQTQPKMKQVIQEQEYTIQQIQLLKEIKTLFLYLQNGYNKFYNTTNFCKLYKNRQFLSIDVRQQQDANQFYNHFSEVMEKIIIKCGKKELFQQIFIGKIVSDYVCSECQNKFSREELFRYLTLEVKGHPNLKLSLDKFTQPQKIQDYFCQNCNKKVKKITKYTTFRQLPQFLTINLHRIFHDFQIGRQVKIFSKLQFPPTIDLKQYVSENSSNADENKIDEEDCYVYRLKAIIIHAGTGQSGHYYSIIRIQEKWYKFDDRNVTEYNINNIESEGFGTTEQYQMYEYDSQPYSKNAYILCYQKQQKKQNPQDSQIVKKKHKLKPGSELQKKVKSQRKTITDQLKICNQSIFQFCFQLFQSIKPADIEEQAKNNIFNENWQEQQNLDKFVMLYQLSFALLKFLKSYWRFQNQIIIPQLGMQIYYLLFLLPEKSYSFIQETNINQPIQYLCFHADPHVKNVYKHALAKSIYVFYNYYQFKFDQNQQCAEHLRKIIKKLELFFTDKKLYQNIFQLQIFFQFWQIALSCIKPIQQYALHSNLLSICAEILSNDVNQNISNYAQLNGNNYSDRENEGKEGIWNVVGDHPNNTNNKQVKYVPANVGKVLCKIVQILVSGKCIKQQHQHMMIQNQNNIDPVLHKPTLSQQELNLLQSSKFYKNILKNNLDSQKHLGSVLAKLCRNNYNFSKQIGQFLLQSLKLYENKNQILLIVNDYILQFLAIKDDFIMMRIKWILGIFQLQMGDQCVYGFRKDQRSYLYRYVSPLFFSQFYKYPALLQILLNANQFKDYRETNLNLLLLLIQLMLISNFVLVYVRLVPSPNCFFPNYFNWLETYEQKLQEIHQTYFPYNKALFIQKFKTHYADLKQGITNKQNLQSNQPLNKYLIGANKNIEVKYQLANQDYNLNLLEHETYFLPNKPTGKGNNSIEQYFFLKPEARYFISLLRDKDKEKYKNGNSDQQARIQSKKSVYTLIIKCSQQIKITFNMKKFKQEIFLSYGKSFINFPYQQIESQEQFQKSVVIKVLQKNLNKSNRKYNQDINYTSNKQLIQINIVEDNRQKKSCPHCTFLNFLSRIYCEVCLQKM